MARYKAYGQDLIFPDDMPRSEVARIIKESRLNPDYYNTQQIQVLMEMKSTFERAIEAIQALDLNVDVAAPDAPEIPAPDMSEVSKVLAEGFEVQKVLIASMKPQVLDTQPIADAIMKPVEFETDVLSRDHVGRIKKMNTKVV